MRVLVVDDDQPVRKSLTVALARDAYEVDVAEDGTTALEKTRTNNYDALVLDILMPGVDGLTVCRKLRARGDRTPILMLTARDLVSDRVAGLDAGADDYLAKPFAIEELRARIRALVRRSRGDDGETLQFADILLSPSQHEAVRGDRRLNLTRTEFALLELFLRHPRQVLTRSVMYEHVWGYDFGPDSNGIWVYISYLRAKLEEGGERA